MAKVSLQYLTAGKCVLYTFDQTNFVGKVMSLLFNILSMFVIVFLPRIKNHLISRMQSPSAVILEPPQNKVCHCFHCFPIHLPWSDGTGCHDLSFLNAEFKQGFHYSLTFLKRLFSSSSFSAIEVVSSAYLKLFIFLSEILFQLVLHTAWHFTWCTLHRS